MFLFERNLLKERTDVIRLQCLDDSGHTIGSVQIWANSKPVKIESELLDFLPIYIPTQNSTNLYRRLSSTERTMKAKLERSRQSARECR